jgi:hypothetical protein
MKEVNVDHVTKPLNYIFKHCKLNIQLILYPNAELNFTKDHDFKVDVVLVYQYKSTSFVY